jgi:hypothetical protein
MFSARGVALNVTTASVQRLPFRAAKVTRSNSRRLTTLWAFTACYRDSFLVRYAASLSRKQPYFPFEGYLTMLSVATLCSVEW